MATGGVVPSPEWNPLTNDEALIEAELLDIRLDPGRSTVGLMLDINGVLGAHDGNVGVLVARQVHSMSWAAAGTDLARLGDRYARYILGAKWSSSARDPLRLDLFPQIDTELNITARQFDFYGVDIEGLSETPPDYTELDDAEIHRQRPDWNSPFRLLTHSARAAIAASGSPPGQAGPRRRLWPRLGQEP